MFHALRMYNPYRDIDRAATVASAISHQLRLAENLNPLQARLVELVRRHGLAIREISVALGHDRDTIVVELREAFAAIDRLDRDLGR